MPNFYGLHPSDVSSIKCLFQRFEEDEGLLEDVDRPSEQSVSETLPLAFDALPLEVIQKTFVHCLPTDHNPIMSLHQSPLLLTRVSKKWRHTATRTTELWRSLHIPIVSLPLDRLFGDAKEDGNTNTAADEEVVSGVLQIINDWLSRASTQTLDLSYVDVGQTAFPGSSRILQETIIKFSPQIKKLDISALNPTFQSLDIIPAKSLPLLEILHMRHHQARRVQAHWSGGLLCAPKLRSLHLRKPPQPLTDLAVAWMQLTNLSIRAEHDPFSTRYLSLGEIGTVLRSCRHLVSCEVEIFQVSHLVGSPSDTISRPISLPHLRRLVIHQHDGDLGSFFEFLDAPHLAHLEFYTDASAAPRPALSVIHHLSSKGSNLLHFGTDLIAFTQEDLIQVLDNCPHLTSLSIKSFDVPEGEDFRSNFLSAAGISHVRRLPLNDEFLQQFIIPIRRGTCHFNLVPEMRYLEILLPSKFSSDTMLEFIKFKQESGVPLEGLSFCPGQGSDNLMVLDMKRMADIKPGADLQSLLRPF